MLNKLIQFIFKNKTYFLFSLFKYIEYVITSLLFFHLANKLSPNSYGTAASSFLIITYSSFVVIGINQVLVKWYSNVYDYQFNINLIRYFFLYISIFALITFFIVYNTLDYEYVLYVSLICSLKLIIDGAGTIFRVKEKPLIINYINLSTSLIFSILYYFNVTNIETFFKIWSFSLLISLFFSIISLVKIKVFSEVLTINNYDSSFYNWLNLNFKKLFSDGFKLAAITILATLFNSIDRIFYINIYDLPSIQIGNIQLADNISNLLNIAIGSFLFVITPPLLRKIRNNLISITDLYHKSIFIMISFSILVFIFIQPISIILLFFFPQYQLIKYPLLFSLTYKLLNLGFFVPGLISMVYDNEIKYIKIGAFWLGFNAITIYLLSFFIQSTSAFLMIPLINTTFLILLHFHYYFQFSKKILAN